MAWLELHLAVFLFGISGLFGKLIAASPVLIVAGRTTFAAIAIFIGLKIFAVKLPATSRMTLFTLLLSGLVLALHWVTFFHSIQISTVATGLIGFATFPVFVTFFEPFLFDQKIRGVDIVSALLVMAGLILVAPGLDLADRGTVGLLWAVTSGALFAVLSLLNRRLVGSNSFLVVALFQHSTAAFLLLPFVVYAAETPDSSTVWLLLILGVLCTALPQTLFIKSLTALRAQLASVVTGLEPVYGILFAAMLLGEIPDMPTIAGAALVFAAVILAMKAHSISTAAAAKKPGDQ